LYIGAVDLGIPPVVIGATVADSVATTVTVGIKTTITVAVVEDKRKN